MVEEVWGGKGDVKSGVEMMRRWGTVDVPPTMNVPIPKVCFWDGDG